jgi:hypothetical protein
MAYSLFFWLFAVLLGWGFAYLSYKSLRVAPENQLLDSKTATRSQRS